MNSSVETTTTTSRGTTRRRIRSLALTASAAALSAAVATGLGLGPSAAQADPGDTFVATGSSQLIQSEDLSSIQLNLDKGAIHLSRNDPFSSCMGEGVRWTDVVSGSGKPVSVYWSKRGNRFIGLAEYISQAKSPAQAKQWSRALLKEGVRQCQDGASPFDFHYGPTDTFRVGSGVATTALSYRGNETKPDGGVVVFRKGDNVGYIQVSGTFGSAEQTMESVAKVAVSRLYGE